MAETIKYVSLSNLTKYDEKIKAHIDTKDAALKTNLEGQVEVVANALDSEITTARTNEATNAAAAQAAQKTADDLKTYVGTFTHDTAKSVVEYINAKTDGIATSGNLEALGARVTAVEGDVATIKGDYLRASDKTELQGKITAEETARTEADAGLSARIKAVEDDYLKAADKEELQGNIDTVSGAVERLTNGVSAEEVDGVNDLIQYVKDHGTEVTGMQEDISDNATAIDGVSGRVGTLEGQIATKAEAQALTDAVAALEGADETLGGKIEELEAKFGEGEGSVADMIADAVDAEATRVDGELAKKVDKVDGKGLSTNDLTNELKGQYDAAYTHSQEAHAPADAQKNVIETVKVNGTAVTVTDKAVDIVVPTDNAQLTNGAKYLVAADIANKADKATTLAGYGIADAYTSAQTDTAIANAMANFVECSEEEVLALFQ